MLRVLHRILDRCNLQTPHLVKGVNPAYIFQPTFRLNEQFDSFFHNINPAATWRARASSQYNSLKSLLEGNQFLRSNLALECRTQGSYDRYTAIHSINDIDIVAFCTGLFYPPTSSGFHPSLFQPSPPLWSRDDIFQAIENVIVNSGLYRNVLVPSNNQSMCIKLDLGIKVEILPVVQQTGALFSTNEPFYLWRPSTCAWELGFAQLHQSKLSEKNSNAYHTQLVNGDIIGYGTDGNFIPAVKVLKHLCSVHNVNAVSFHVECLLYSLPCHVFWGNPSSFICQILNFIAEIDPLHWYSLRLVTPCGDRNLFSPAEWQLNDWLTFHSNCKQWRDLALRACTSISSNQAIANWQQLLGNGWFPSS